jgi:hypothetical protein
MCKVTSSLVSIILYLVNLFVFVCELHFVWSENFIMVIYLM